MTSSETLWSPEAHSKPVVFISAIKATIKFVINEAERQTACHKLGTCVKTLCLECDLTNHYLCKLENENLNSIQIKINNSEFQWRHSLLE